jgi:hypothetical protein
MPDAGRAAKQTIDEIHQLIRRAVISRRSVFAFYHGHDRFFCPHRLGRNRDGELRALCYQYGGTSESGLEPEGSPKNWRCIAVERLSNVMLRRGRWRTAPNHSRPQTCIIVPGVDAEDQPEGEPQNGQHSSRRSS